MLIHRNKFKKIENGKHLFFINVSRISISQPRHHSVETRGYIQPSVSEEKNSILQETSKIMIFDDYNHFNRLNILITT